MGTIWYRMPATLAHRRVQGGLALALAILIGTPSVLVILKGKAWTEPIAASALDLVQHDSLRGPMLEGRDSARRAALPARLEALVAKVLPKLGLLGLVAALSSAGGVFLLGHFLRKALPIEDPHHATTPIQSITATQAALVFLAGMAAHVPTLLQSFNIDEAAAVLHASQHWWSWADTRTGWQTHIGGEALIRLGLLLPGRIDVVTRLLSILVSAAGLVLVFKWVRRHGESVGILTVALLCALPVWAEQTALARGYGLLFFAGALGIAPLWRVLDGVPERRDIPALFASHLLGFAAHFFFAFFSVASIVLLFRRRTRLAAVALTWILLGLVPAALLHLPGVPATLVQTVRSKGATLPFSVVLLRFVEAFGFDLSQPVQWVACGLLLASCGVGLLLLSTPERRRIGIVLVISIGLPMLLRPVYFYPRFFLHLSPLLFVATVPWGSWLRQPAWALVAGLILWALPQPWAHGPTVDLRAGCNSLRELAHGEPVRAAQFFASARVYLSDVSVTFGNLSEPAPQGTRALMAGQSMDGPEPAFKGFRLVRRLPGRETELLTFEAEATQQLIERSP